MNNGHLIINDTHYEVQWSIWDRIVWTWHSVVKSNIANHSTGPQQ